MLIRILETIAVDQIYSPTSLAKRLGVSEALLVSMMEDLADRGYLAPLLLDDQGGGGTCRGCSGCKPDQACPSIGARNLRGWALTHKGLALVKGHL